MRRRTGFPRKPLALLLGLLLASAGVAERAGAQNLDMFRADEFGGYVQLGVRSESEKRVRDTGETPFEFNELEFEQFINLTSNGFVYHPRFIRYWGNTEIRFHQELRDGDDPTLVGGDGRITFLEEHPYSLSLYTNIQETEVDRTFARTFKIITKLYGMGFNYRQGPLPFLLSYDHRLRDGEGAGADIDEVGDDISWRSRYEMGIAESSRGKIEYYWTVEEIGQLEQKRRRQRFLASNTTFLDAERRKRFTGSLRVHEQRDFTDTLTTAVITDFNWRHTDTLSTRYRVDFQRNDFEVQTTNHLNLTGSIRHQLYESLTTALDGYSRFENATFGDTQWYGGTLVESYTKRLGGWGRLGISASPWAEIVQRRPSRKTAIVIDETVVMQDGVPVELAQLDVDIVTIEVTDSTGAIVYEEGTDYTVFERGSVTELRRLVTGLIVDGENVLVDYTFRTAPPSDLLSSGINLQLNVWIQDAVRLYGRVLTSDQRVLSGFLGARLEDRDARTGGVELSRPWMSMRAEYVNDDSTFVSYHSVSESLSLFTPGESRWRVRFSALNHDQVYTSSDEEVSRITLTGGVDARIGRRGRFEIDGDYRRERWRGGPQPEINNVDGFGVRSSFTWYFRDIRVRLEGRLSQLDQAGQKEDRHRVILRVRRTF